MYVHGLCLYYKGDLDEGISYFDQALAMDANHGKAEAMQCKARRLKNIKNLGNSFITFIISFFSLVCNFFINFLFCSLAQTYFQTCDYIQAYHLYSKALEIDPWNEALNAKLFFNRALMSFKMIMKITKTYNMCEVIADLNNALRINPDYWKALVMRANCFKDFQMFQRAIIEYKKALIIFNTNEVKEALEDTEKALQLWNRDYYFVLGIDEQATSHKMEKSYRRLVSIHRPERHINEPTEFIREHEKILARINTAYDYLSKQYRHKNGNFTDDEDW